MGQISDVIFNYIATVDWNLNSNIPQTLVSNEVPITHAHSQHQFHLESSNTASDQVDQAKTFEDKLQIKKEKKTRSKYLKTN
jgi:hypothetical protein